MAKEPKAILCPYCGLMQSPTPIPGNVPGSTPGSIPGNIPGSSVAIEAPTGDGGAEGSAAGNSDIGGLGGGMRCVACGGLFDHLSRKATQIAMGPWYIRDKTNPFRPGCSFEVLKRQIEAGRIKPTTVLRGPTTRQFWAIARNVPGVGHLLGYCPRCGRKVTKGEASCPECAEPFLEPDERNELGLVYPTKASADHAAKQLDRELEGLGKPGPTPAGVGSTTTAPAESARGATKAADPGDAQWQPGLDLLDEVIGGSAKKAPAGPAAPKSKLAAMSSPVSPSAKPTAMAPTLKLGAALDFGPSDESDEPAQPAVSPVYGAQNRHMQLVVWLLVAVNLLLLPILLGALLYFLGVFGNEPEVTQPSPAISLFNDDFAEPAAAPPPHPAVGPAPAPITPVTPPPPPTTVTPVPPTAPAPAQPSNLTQAIKAAMNEAQRYEDAGEFTRAITLLQDVQKKTRPEDRPANLDARIARIQNQIDRAEAAKFFGMPVNPDKPAH